MPPKSKKRQVRGDKRSRADLELFVLAMVERGFNTPYALRASCALSAGATIPVLNRLEQDGYLHRGKAASRNRAEYRITGEGSRYLRQGCARLLDTPPPSEVEPILRVTTLAMLADADFKRLSRYLNEAAVRKATESERRKMETDAINLSDSSLGDPKFYPWALALYTSQKSAAESKFLRQLGRAFLKARE